MEMMIEGEYQCPYCGQTISVTVDPSAGSRQEYVEDCQVCCKPVRLSVTIENDDEPAATIDASPENE